MNCPKCKNPIEDNATICEWCGASCVSKGTWEKELNKRQVELQAKNGCLFVKILFWVLGGVFIIVGWYNMFFVGAPDSLSAAYACFGISAFCIIVAILISLKRKK